MSEKNQDLPKEDLLYRKGKLADMANKEDINELAEEIKKHRKKKRQIKVEDVEEKARALEALFQPDQFESLISLPGETLFALTGWEPWLLSQKEKSILATSASSCAKYWLAIEPKYVALLLFGFQFAQIYGTRYLSYTAEQKKNAKAEKK